MTLLRVLLFIVLCIVPAIHGSAQHHLNRPVNLQVHKQPIASVLQEVGRQAGFSFSYNSRLFPSDSLVSVTARNLPVRHVLDSLFHNRFEYKESGNHIIIQLPSTSDIWYLSGYVFDQRTGERIRDVSVYETQQLVATLTNDEGYFRLKLKDKHPTATINIRKAWYMDTSVVLKPGANQELTVSISPKSFLLDTLVVSPVEKSWLTNLFLSSRQKAQNLNLGKFLVDRPYQTSIVPGVGTHGKLGSHVVNKFSFNILGGYTAGLQGVEIGGIFNIVKENMSFLQIAGVFNMTGGYVEGVQISGVFNQSLDSVTGLQLGGAMNLSSGSIEGMQTSGAVNYTAGKTRGMQLTGAVNYSAESVKGMQLSGLANYSGGSVNGMQLTGAANITAADMKGVQLSGFLNYAKTIDGVQIGIINVADSSTRFSFGLLNLFRNGYYKLSMSYQEAIPYNLSLSTGTKKLYNILMVGVNPEPGKQNFSYGLGFGALFELNKTFSIAPEASAQYSYRGDRLAFGMLYRGQGLLNCNITKHITAFAGPSLTFYHFNSLCLCR